MRAASLVAALLTGTVFASFLALAWTGPTAPPPGNNVDAPLNAGTVDQVKDAGLALNALAVFGDAIISSVGSESGVRYLSFGTLPGADGFGIRNNDGTLEFKNSGGSWSGVATANSVVTSIQNFFSASSTNTVNQIKFADGTTQTTAAGGVTEQTTATCTVAAFTPCTVSCPVTYIRSGCGAYPPSPADIKVQPSGSTACTCTGNGTCYAYCVK